MEKTVIVLGANGRFGRAAVAAFRQDGWKVTRLVRPGKGAGAGTAEADATDAPALTRACAGHNVIVNALNPPYHKWRTEMPKLTASVIAAARANGAGVLIPGNVYNYGTDLPAVLTADTPKAASHGKGLLREEMEAAFRASGVPTMVLRAGDFIEAEKTGNWFDSIICKDILKGKFAYPGAMDLPHAWAYLPDMARAAAMLAQQADQWQGFAEVLFPGYTMTGQDLHAHLSALAGRDLRTSGVPWFAIRALGLVSPLMKEVAEMRYLWARPHAIDATGLETALPDFRATPVRSALAQALPDLDAEGHAYAVAKSETFG